MFWIVWVVLILYIMGWKLPQEIKEIQKKNNQSPSSPSPSTSTSPPRIVRLYFHFYLSFLFVSLIYFNLYINWLWMSLFLLSPRQIYTQLYTRENETMTFSRFGRPRFLPFYKESNISIVFEIIGTVVISILTLLFLFSLSHESFQEILKTEKAVFQPIWNAMKICLSISAWYLIPILAFFQKIIPFFSSSPLSHVSRLSHTTTLLLCIALFLFLFCFWLTLSRRSVYSKINSSLSTSSLQKIEKIQNTQTKQITKIN
jgi:hypothetical protein